MCTEMADRESVYVFHGRRKGAAVTYNHGTYCELSSLFILLSSRMWRFLTLSKRSSSAWISASSWRWREETVTTSVYLWYKKTFFYSCIHFHCQRWEYQCLKFPWVRRPECSLGTSETKEQRSIAGLILCLDAVPSESPHLFCTLKNLFW